MRSGRKSTTLLGWALLATTGTAGCWVEININTDSDEDEAPVTVDLRTGPRATAPEAPPAPPTAPEPPARPDMGLIPLPLEEPPVVHDLLLRYDRPPLPEPAQPELKDIFSAPAFTPFTVAPRVLNPEEVRRAIEREYPDGLREADVGGTVRLYFLIDDRGTVLRRLIDERSGHAELDDAALRVARVYRFTPALNHDAPVPVWVSFPVTFRVR